MGKTKRLAEDVQEERSTSNLEPSKTIQLKGLPMEVFNSVYNYLGTRPHREVANIIKALESSFDVNATITDGSQNNQPNQTTGS